MKAILFDAEAQRQIEAPETLPGLPQIALREVPDPKPNGDDWVVVRSRITGICGSDIGFLQGKEMPAAEPYFGFPLILGHELFGVVEAAGPRCEGIAVGDRVAVDPTLACRERGFKEECGACAVGHPSRCENLDGGPQGPGFLIGACAGAGGGWSERYAAPAWRLFRVPDEVEDEEASLVEPFSICLHAVLRQPPEPGQHALVLGAGTIGLLTVASLRAVCPGVKIICTAKYPFQGELAGTLGADTVIDAGAPDVMDRIARATGSGSFPLTGGGSLLRTGADWTCDTVTNANSLKVALHATRAGGSVIMLGLAGVGTDVDWTPVWMKELSISGSFLYGTEPFEGVRRPTFDVAVDLLGRRRADLRAIQPRLFALDDHDEALKLAASKATSAAAKVSFAF